MPRHSIQTRPTLRTPCPSKSQRVLCCVVSISIFDAKAHTPFAESSLRMRDPSLLAATLFSSFHERGIVIAVSGCAGRGMYSKYLVCRQVRMSSEGREQTLKNVLLVPCPSTHQPR